MFINEQNVPFSTEAQLLKKFTTRAFAFSVPYSWCIFSTAKKSPKYFDQKTFFTCVCNLSMNFLHCLPCRENDIHFAIKSFLPTHFMWGFTKSTPFDRFVCNKRLCIFYRPNLQSNDNCKKTNFAIHCDTFGITKCAIALLLVFITWFIYLVNGS